MLLLKNIYLKNFRNFLNLELNFSSNCIVFEGFNGSGKSNLLESLYYLGTASSYRHHTDETLVKWKEDFFLIKGKVEKYGVDHLVEIGYNLKPRKKNIKINGKTTFPSKLSDYLTVVVFSPADLLFIQGSPSLRRSYLDLVVCQLRPSYSRNLRIYKQALIQRNNLLKQGIFNENKLQPWNTQLIEIGSLLIKQRLEVLFKLTSICEAILNSLGLKVKLEVGYLSKIFSSLLFIFYDDLKIKQAYQEAFKNYKQLEEKFKTTIIGPHRDDFTFFINKKNAHHYASQGEQRLLVLALKIAQIKIIEEELKIKPVLLLDDLFSELDEKRRQELFQEINKGSQVIITTTSWGREKWQLERGVEIYTVCNGEIIMRR